MIPPVVASDRGIAQTGRVAMLPRGSRTTLSYFISEEKSLESLTIAGESPLSEATKDVVVS
jgi:hypothetical protein